MGDPRERNYQSLFSELAGYEKKGVYMLMNGVPASPMQIVQAHIVREDAVYMRDYVLNDNGDIKELCFDDVEMQEQDRRYSLRQGAHCPVDNGFAPTETECRLAEVRSRSMSCNCMTRTSQQECRGILEKKCVSTLISKA